MLSLEAKSCLIAGMGSILSGNELILAIHNHSVLSRDAMTRLQTGLSDKDVAIHFQACILGNYALSLRDQFFVQDSFDLPLSALASVFQNLAGGIQLSFPIRSNPPVNVSMPFGFLFTAQVMGPAQQQSFVMTFPAGSTFASTGNGKYFEMYSGANADKYYVWYSVGGGSNSDPSPSDFMGIEVDIAGSDTAAQVAAKTQAAIAAEVAAAYSSVLGAAVTFIPATNYVIPAISSAVANATFSPVFGAYASTQSVSLSSVTPGALIYFTTNGSTPTTSSTLYSAPISVASTSTVKALAVKAGSPNSAITSSAYTINGAVATPTFSPVAGAYGPTQSVTVSSATSGATFYYTLNGSTPTTSSTLYSGPVSVSASETLKVLAVKAVFLDSAVASAAYTINGAVATPTFSPVAGTYAGTQNVTVSSTTAGSTFYYTLNGSTPTTGSTLYSGPVAISASETLKVLAVHAGFSDSAIGSAAYVITALGPTAVDLAQAGAYRVFSEAGISTSAGTLITGDIAVSPIAHTAIIGFTYTPNLAGVSGTATEVTGAVFTPDNAVPTPGDLTTATTAMTNAYTDAATRASPAPIVDLNSGDLGGQTLQPGIYKFSTAVTIPTNMTINGGVADVVIIQIAGALDLTAGMSVLLTGGILPQNIFWQASGVVSLGVSSVFNGVILGAVGIDVNTTATIHGALYSQTAITLLDNAISA